MQSIRQQIVAAANRYIGTPWRRYGRSQYGLDCVGLLIVIANELGLGTYTIEQYSKDYKYIDLIQNLNKANCIRIPRYKLNIGDILVMTLTDTGVHAGIYCGSSSMIHANIKSRKVIKSGLSTYEKYITDQYTFPGVT